jgi:hypothetical protein
MKPFVKKTTKPKQVVFPRAMKPSEMKFKAVVARGGGNNGSNMIVFLNRKLKNT